MQRSVEPKITHFEGDRGVGGGEGGGARVGPTVYAAINCNIATQHVNAAWDTVS